jgi:hypothetical protein
MDAIAIINKLFEYYQVYTINELAKILGVQQSIVSGWKSRNSVNPLKKKCRELGIYKKIFENETSIGFNQISKEDINAKLFHFHRRSLIYLLFLLQKKDINNGLDYFNWQVQKDETNMFKNFAKDWWHDFKNENVSFSFNRSEADQYISLFIKIDELDYIFQNKDIFMKSIIVMSNIKR